MKIFRAIFLIFLCSISVAAQTSNYKFRHYTINEGLVESQVSVILQDSRGFLWFGSTGLSKFDGYKFTNYINHSDDSTSLINNMVQALYEDQKGQLWVGTRAGIVIYNREKNYFTPVFPEKFNNQLNVSFIAQDDEGLFYIGTYGTGLITYDPKTKERKSFRYDGKDLSSICSDWPSKILFSSDKRIWIATYHGLNLFDKATKKFTRFKRTEYTKPDWAKDAIISIAFDKSDCLWLGTRYGITRFNPKTREYKDFMPQSIVRGKSPNLEIRTLQFVNDTELWAGSQNGIIILNTKTGKTTNIQHQENDFESLGGNEVEDLYLDKNNNLWIATRATGVDKLKFLTERFYHYKNTYPAYRNLSSNEIYGMTEDKDKNIWFATLNGLNKFFPEREVFQNYLKKNHPDILTDYQWTVYTNKKIKNDFVWVGTDAGLFVMSISLNKVINPFKNPNLLDSLKYDRIMAICIDNNNNLFIGSENGLIKINLTTEKIKRYLHSEKNSNSISNSYIWRLFTDTRNNLWIGTTNGLNMLKPGTDNFISFRNKRNDRNSISNNEVCEIFEDKNGILWIGTSDGLNKFDPVQQKFEKINLSIASVSIYSIQQDKSGCFWIGTGKGLLKYSPKDESTILYDNEDGIQSNEFNFPSLVSSSGEFYFTGINGFNIFYPEEIYSNKHIPPVYITGFSVMNKQINTGDKYNGRVLINTSLEETKEITLNYNENIISFEFAALDFQSPNKNQYLYLMENYENAWNQAGGRRFVTYNLEPGTYHFRVKGSNNDNLWNETGVAVTINILPPWWKTVWFKIIAAISALSILYFIFYSRTSYLKKQKANLERLVQERTSELEKQHEIVNEQAERIQLTNVELEQLNSELELRVIERTAELEKAKIKAEKADEIKSEFLAQMSHEIRSPINVVLSFTNLIRAEVEDKIDPDLREGFNSISNAGKRIIRTVDLLLNMSEIQTQTYEFIPDKVDLIKDILNSLLPEYQLSAKEKGLALSLENNGAQTEIIGDQYTLEQIFANLIDNAIKYTNNGSVAISVTNDKNGIVVCRIEDTGIGISEEFMDKIFIPFTQEEHGYTRKYEGNGLGLALVKKYCELNEIGLSVESTKGAGTAFTLKFNRVV